MAWGFVAIGLMLRAFHYGRNPSVWHDEAAVIVNVLEKNFLQLLGPLRFSEAAPPLFLWLERAVQSFCGQGTFALRAMPFGASCLTVILAPLVSAHYVERRAIPWAVLLVACSDRLLWHACEAKQYSLEVFCALVVLAVCGRITETNLSRQMALLTVMAPIIICIAYPGCFLYGGVLLALLLRLRRQHQFGVWLGYGLLALVVGGTFWWLLQGPIRAQHDSTISACWAEMRQFPDWARPWTIVPWALSSTFHVSGYCFRPVGEALLPLAAVGGVVMWRQGKQDLLLLLTGPALLVFVAACLGKYPYGGTRVLAFVAPSLAFLIAAGVALVSQWLGERRSSLRAVPLLLVIAPVACAAYRVVVPWPRAACDKAAAFVLEHRAAEELVVSNHWEYEYYFRDLGAAHVQAADIWPHPPDRCWLVVTGLTIDLRDEVIRRFLRDRTEPALRKEFDRTSVLWLASGPSKFARGIDSHPDVSTAADRSGAMAQTSRSSSARYSH
jgi:hypothetical protein